MPKTTTDEDRLQRFPLAGGDLEPDDAHRNDEKNDDDDEVTRCGFGFHPAFLQPFAKVGWFTGFYGIAGLLTSSLSAYVNSQLTTLERQFGFSSKQTSLIMAANDIGFLVSVLFLSYLANMVHIPRALGIITICYGFSGLICSLPHFLYGHDLNLDPNEELTNQSSVLRDQSFHGQLCQYENRSLLDQCSESATDSSFARPVNQQVALASLAIIVTGMIMQGLAKSPRFSFVVTYIDGNTKPTKTGFFMGCLITMVIFGPALSFILGGLFTRMYVTLEETSLTPRHPRWIGAWWLGYVAFGAISVVLALPLFCFPRRMPRKDGRQQSEEESRGKTPSYKEQDNSAVGRDRLGHVAKNATPTSSHTQNAGNSSKDTQRQKVIRQVKDFLSTFLRLWTNPVYVLVLMGDCFIMFTVGGVSAYSPKYMERIFDQPASRANFIIAIQMMSSSCLGTFIGGYLSKRLKLRAYTALLFILIISVITVFISFTIFFFKCEQPETQNVPGSTSSCSTDCQCEDNSFFPVCGSDGRTYYSPCSAGCLTVSDGSYVNCTCIEGGAAQEGICPYDCDHLYYYAVATCLRALLGTMTIVPKITVVIRTVEPKDKPLAMGLTSFMTSLFGWMLGPVVFGAIIDGICVIWDIKCGVQGRCLLYDNDQFRIRLNSYVLASQLGGFLSYLGAFLYAKFTGFLDRKATESYHEERVALEDLG